MRRLAPENVRQYLGHVEIMKSILIQQTRSRLELEAVSGSMSPVPHLSGASSGCSIQQNDSSDVPPEAARRGCTR
jgi:hypothetical protein